MQNNGDAILVKLTVLNPGFVTAIDIGKTYLFLGNRCRVPSAFTPEGTLILRRPIKMFSNSEMPELCRSLQDSESLGIVAELFQMRLEARMVVSSKVLAVS